MNVDIHLKVTYPVNEPEKFQIETNAKPEVVGELITEFVRGQAGSGADSSPPNDHDVFEITLGIDLSDDTWGVKDNCGNKGLRDGILLAVLGKIEKSENLDWLNRNDS